MLRRVQSGFTMLEIAIVIAVVGLIIGAIMSGKHLMRAAQAGKVVSDAKTYATSILQFKEKYGALPGDFGNAVATLGATTVNGIENGLIGSPAGAGLTGENFQLWNQLQLAGFITGTYTGLAGASGMHHSTPGVNVPIGAIKDTAYWHYNWGYQSGGATFFEGDYTNAMVYGKNTGNSWPHGSILTGVEAYDIDRKVDDSFPGNGSIRTLAGTWMWANTGECIPNAADNAQTARYVRKPTAGVTHGCMLLFLNTFMAPTTR